MSQAHSSGIERIGPAHDRNGAAVAKALAEDPSVRSDDGIRIPSAHNLDVRVVDLPGGTRTVRVNGSKLDDWGRDQLAHNRFAIEAGRRALDALGTHARGKTATVIQLPSGRYNATIS